MRCERCKASHEVYYAESSECDWYCDAGVLENDMNEDKNGQWGCNLHYKTINKILDKNQEAWIADKEAFVDWFLNNKEGRE